MPGISDFFANIGNSASNQLDNIVNTISNPGSTLENRINSALGTTATTYTPPPQAPVAPTQMGPTVAANEGQQPNNPLNGQGARPAQMPAPVSQGPVAPQTPATAQAPAQITPQQVASPQQPAPAPAGPAPAQPQPASFQNGQFVPGSDHTFNSMIGAESQGQHYTPQGGILTSPTGAQGIAQVQPTTAAQPGFGVQPMSPQDLADPNKNLKFGQDYLNGLRRYFNGDDEKAVAAYNGGAGTVDKAIANGAKTGRDWRELLPAETQAYLKKVVDHGTNAQEQQTLTALAQQQQILNKDEAFSGQGIKMPDGTTPAHYEVLNSGDDAKLWDLAKDPATPPAVAKTAQEKLFQNMDLQRKIDDADAKYKQIVASKDPNAINNALRSKDSGSLLKAILYKRLGLDDLAEQEQQKISPTLTAMPVMLGNDHYAGQYDKFGNLVSARDENGLSVDANTLSKLQANAFAAKGAKTEGTMVQDAKGDAYSKTVVPGRPGFMWRNERTGEMSATMPQGATPFGQINPVSKANLSLSTSIERQMKAANIKAQQQGLQPPYSDEDIESEKVRILNGGKPSEQLNGAPEAAPSPLGTQRTAKGKLSPDLETQAQEIYAGRQPIPTGLGANNLRNQAIVNRVNEIAGEQGKPFDSTLYHRNKTTLESYEGNGQNSKDVRSLITSVNHIGDLDPLFKDLHNGKYPDANAFYNAVGTRMGEPGPQAAKIGQELVAGEINKFLTSGKGGTASEREELRAGLSPNASPTQIDKAIQTYKNLLTGKLETYKNQYEAAGGDFWGHVVQNPAVKEMYDRHEAEKRVRAGQTPSGTAAGIKWKKVD